MTPAGIEPATFRFVAQRLNHCATAVPLGKKVQRRNQLGEPTKERRENEKWQIKDIRVELTHHPFLWHK